MIAATLVVMGAAIGWPLSGLVKANSETVITPMQSSGKITKDTDLTFKIEDSDGIAWIYYGWDRHKNQTTGYDATVKGNGGTSQNYTESHHLIIQLEDITFDFIPHPPEYYGEDVESWRFFQFGGKSEHLVVSALTIELQ